MRLQSRIAFLLLAMLPLALPAQQPKTIGEVTLFGEEQLKVEAATKTEIPISKAPSAVTVITAKQIAESGARTVSDLLRLVAGVNVRWNPMIQTVDIRGFGENPFSNRLLLLIDGVAFNSGDTGGFPLSPGFEFFPIQTIKRIEVVRGPGSSLYGENAYWGVINIVTLSGEDLAGGGLQLFGGSRTTGQLNGVYGTKLRNGSIIGSVRLLQSQFPVEFWKERGSKFRAGDFFLKGSHKDWQLEVYRHDDRLDGFVEIFPSEFGLPPTAGWRSAREIEQTIDSVTLKYNHAPQNAAITYAADLSWVHRYGMHCAGCHAAPQKPEFSHPENHGYQAVGDFRLGLHMIPGHDALVGVEARRLDRADHKHELASFADAVSGYDKVAFYIQDQFDLVKNALRAVAGIRYDGKTDLFDAKTSPRLALVFTPNDRLVVRGGYSTAFRFPTFSELYQASWFINAGSDRGVFPAFPFAVFAPNPNLQPEEITTFDLGGEYQILPTVSAKADLYRSRVKRFIVITQRRQPPPAPVTIGWENHSADARITGGELELRSNFARRFTTFVNWAHQTASQSGSGGDSNGLPMEFVYSPKNKINIGAYGGPFAGFRGTMEMSWRDKYRYPVAWAAIRPGIPNPLPSYTLLNARLSYDLPLRGMGNDRPLRLSVFGNNLLDKRPEETIVGPRNRIVGREFFAQLELHF
jgi:iron complex outermembrane receptor protein